MQAIYPQENSQTFSISMMQVTKSPEEASSLPNGDVTGEAQSTTEVRAGILNHLLETHLLRMSTRF